MDLPRSASRSVIKLPALGSITSDSCSGIICSGRECCVRARYALLGYISSGGVASETSNGRNGPCPVHLPLQAESNFRPSKKLAALGLLYEREREHWERERECPHPLEINNTLHAKMAAQLDGNARWWLLLRGVDGRPLIGHCPSLSRSFFIFSPGAERVAHPPSSQSLFAIDMQILVTNKCSFCNPDKLWS